MKILLAMVCAFGLLFITGDSFAQGKGKGKEKVTICHVPPGNPQNAHTITIGEPALTAHMAHGDQLGECGQNGNPTSELDECDQAASLDHCVGSGIYF